jgi:hypothetical protein
MRAIQTGVAQSRLAQALHASRQRLEGWLGDLAATEQLVQQSAHQNVGSPLTMYLMMTISNMVAALVELQGVVNAVARGQTQPGTAGSLGDVQQLLALMQDTVANLEKVQGTLPGTDIAAIKRRLEKS